MEQIVKKNAGLDISMDTFWATITVLNVDYEIKHVKSKEFKNNEKGFKEMYQWQKDVYPELQECHYTMEATGVYYEQIAYYLYQQRCPVHVVLPNKAKKFAESLDIKSKTDKLDSKALGRLGVERKLRDWQPSEPIYKELKELTRERGRLIKICTQFKNNLHSLTHSYQPNKKSLKRLKSLINLMDKHVLAIEKEFKEKAKQDINIKAKLDILTSIPGVGEVTALIVMAETNGFALMQNSRQLCSYAGLDVRECESGKWKGKSKISKKGNSHIRAALYFPALTSIKYSTQHKLFYERIIKEKKKSKIGITAVSRKLLVLMYSLWKNDTMYIDNYQSINAA